MWHFTGLSLSFDSPVALNFTHATNLLLCGWIASTKGNFIHNIKGPSNILNRCYGLQPLLTALSMRVPNRFGGMRDLAFFRRDIWDLSWKQGAGSRNYNYEQERDFMFLWGWDVGFTRGTERDSGFQFLRDLINWPAQKPQVGQKWTFSAYSCVRFQVMSINDSVPCQVWSNASIITWLS